MARRRRTPIHHPIQQAIEDVYAAGHTPRLQLDARRLDVDVPDHIRERWEARLVIDLDPSYPLHLDYSERGVECDLSFGGRIARCVLGWAAIYMVIDRSSGKGVVVEQHLPAAELAPELAWQAPRAAPKLEVVRGAGAKSSRPPTEPPIERDTPQVAPLVAAISEPEPVEEPLPSAAGTEAVQPARSRSDEEAAKRRARFRVIDGGGS